MMTKAVRSINWDCIGDAVPAFLAIALIPLTYSISYGLIAGIGTYAAINGSVWVLRIVSGGRIVPDDQDLREPWNNEGFIFENVLPGWVQRLRCAARGLRTWVHLTVWKWRSGSGRRRR